MKTKFYKSFQIILLFLCFFSFSQSKIKAGDEACNDPNYPNCWPSRTLNEYNCTTLNPVSKSWVCSKNNDRNWDGNNCNLKGDTKEEQDAYCNTVQSGYKCTLWWLTTTGAYVENLNQCESTGTFNVQCDTSYGNCNKVIDPYKSCTIQSTTGECSETTTKKTYSCCGGGTAPTEPPTGGTTCTDPAPITPDPVECTRTGFYGKYSGDNGIYGTAYLCDPDSSFGPKKPCSGWTSTWDGYWNIPAGQGGLYEFNVVFNPALRFRFDVDGDKVFDMPSPMPSPNPCSSNPEKVSSGDPSVGNEYYFFLASGCTACRQSQYRPLWLNNSSKFNSPLSYLLNGGNGAAACSNVSDPEGKGYHLERVDVNTLDQDGSCGGATAPVPVPAKYQGTEECPIAALTTDGALDNIKSANTLDEWLAEGSGHSFFTRTLAEGSHKVAIYYSTNGVNTQTPYLDIYYRKGTSGSWIALKDLSNAQCPISPCYKALTCSVSLSPTSWPAATVGAFKTFTATATGADNVVFTVNNSNVSIVSTTATTAKIKALNVGPSTLTATGYIGGVAKCNISANITINPGAVVYPWWQVVDGDVITRGDLSTGIPTTSTTLKFILAGPGGYPGVPWYNASTDLNNTTVSDKGWLVQSDYTSNRVYSSAYFFNKISNNTTINTLTDSTISDGDIESGGTLDSSGYYYYEYDGNNFGGEPLTIDDADGVRLGTRKVIIFVKNAGVNINKTINLTDGSGFLFLVATGDINIDPLVGDETAEPDLEGVFVTDGKFNTGSNASNDNRLYIRGTVVSGSGVYMERDRGSIDNGTEPSEYIEFAADQELLFPEDLSYKPTKWQEVAP